MATSTDSIYRLSLDEVKLMKASESDPNLWARYWLHKEGMDRPFQFDYNFREEDKWQVAAIMAQQELIVAICGVSTGKTLGMGLGAMYHAGITPDFRFFNVGKELDQAKIMYDLILEYTEGTRFQRLIWKSPGSPHPKIEIRFYVGDILFQSSAFFYTAGELGDASNLFSKRGDWFCVDEAWRFDDLMTLKMRLTTRGTGGTARGRSFMGRLMFLSNPLDNPQLWALFDEAAADPEHAAVFLIDTEANQNNTPEQIATQLRNIPENERGYYLTGKRPEGRGSYFSREVVERGESELLAEDLRRGMAAGIPGYAGDYHPALGYWHYRFPWDPKKQYIITSDPGTGAAPARNAPCILVYDVTNAPNLNIIAAMWWGNAGGNIMNWVTPLLEFIQLYRPVYVGVDSTSTQKWSAQLINTMFITGKGYSVDLISGLNFSSEGKYNMLISARLSLATGAFAWPKTATGISSQLKSYDPVADTSKTSLLPQDIVATLSMGSFASRQIFPPTGPDPAGQNSGANKPSRILRNILRGSSARSTRRNARAR